MYLAGEAVTGRLELTCTSAKRAMLGDIDVHLYGIEEIMHNKTQKRRLFLYLKQTIQGESLAPSDAVFAGPADTEGLFQAKKAKTVFQFNLQTPRESNVELRRSGLDAVDIEKQLPSSFWCKFGGIRYFVVATINCKCSSSPVTIKAIRSIELHSRANVSLAPTFATSHPNNIMGKVYAESSKRIGRFYEKKGEVVLTANVHVPNTLGDVNAENTEESLGVWSAGATEFVTVEIKNKSKKTVKKLSVSLIRRLKTFTITESGQITPLSFNRQIVYCKTFKPAKPLTNSKNILRASGAMTEGKDFENVGFWDGCDRDRSIRMGLDIAVPKSLKDVHGGLIEVSHCIRVSIDFDINVEIPVSIVHPLSLMSSLPPAHVNFTHASMPRVATNMSLPQTFANMSIAPPAEVTSYNYLERPASVASRAEYSAPALYRPESSVFQSEVEDTADTIPFSMVTQTDSTSTPQAVKPGYVRSPTPAESVTTFGSEGSIGRHARRAPPPPPSLPAQFMSNSVAPFNSVSKSGTMSSIATLDRRPTVKRTNSISRRQPGGQVEVVRIKRQQDLNELIAKIARETNALNESEAGVNTEVPFKRPMERMEESGLTVVQDEIIEC